MGNFGNNACKLNWLNWAKSLVNLYSRLRDFSSLLTQFMGPLCLWQCFGDNLPDCNCSSGLSHPSKLCEFIWARNQLSYVTSKWSCWHCHPEMTNFNSFTQSKSLKSNSTHENLKKIFGSVMESCQKRRRKNQTPQSACFLILPFSLGRLVIKNAWKWTRRCAFLFSTIETVETGPK